MSNPALDWAFALPMTSPAAKSVLIALANYADDHGRCWPSIPLLMLNTALADKSVRRAIKALHQLGLIHRVVRKGLVTRYQLSMASPVTVTGVGEADPGQSDRTTPVRESKSPVTVTGEPKRTPIEPKEKNTPLPPKPPVDPDLFGEQPEGGTLPDWMPMDAWEGYLDMRRQKGKVPTDRAIELVIGKLDRWRSAGHDPGLILDTSTENGWTGVFEPKQEWRSGRGGQRPEQDRRDGVEKAADRWLGLDQSPSPFERPRDGDFENVRWLQPPAPRPS